MHIQLLAAVPTPFDADGDLNLRAVEPLAARLLQMGVHGAFVGGTTGEWASLSDDERRKLAARWCEVAGDALETIVHAGHTSARVAGELGRQAASVGARGVGSVAPFYVKPDSPETLVLWLAEVAAYTPDTPFYYYHFPLQTGVSLPCAPVLRGAQEAIPNFAGAKFTDTDGADLSACLALDGPRVFVGRETFWREGLERGASSAIGATVPLLARQMHTVSSRWQAGDERHASAAQRSVDEACATLALFGLVRSLKALLGREGVSLGAPRLPLIPLTSHDERALFAAWDEWEAAQ